MNTTALKGLFGLSLLALTASAGAVPIVATSNGYFSNLASCDAVVPGQTCRIVDTANGTNTQVQWGSQSFSTDFVNPSRLTSTDVAINTDSDWGLGVEIARLDWFNSATLATFDLNSFAVNWNLSLAFSAPTGPDPFGSEVFNLTINNPLNPAPDLLFGLRLADLSSLGASLDLSGVTISNLRYRVTDGAGAGTSSFVNSVWTNAENNWSTLSILADFRTRAVAVGEPSTLSLIGLGLLGCAFVAKRRRRNLLQAR